MKSLQIVRGYLIIAIMVFQGLPVFAQHFDMGTREWSSVRDAGTLQTCLPTVPMPSGCDTLITSVDFFNNTSVLGNYFNIKDIRSFVKFYINHEDSNIHSAYTYRLGYEIRGFKTLNSTTPTDIIRDSLMINYNPDSTNPYQDIDMRSYYSYYRIEVKILTLYDYTATYAALIAGSSTIRRRLLYTITARSIPRWLP